MQGAAAQMGQMEATAGTHPLAHYCWPMAAVEAKVGLPVEVVLVAEAAAILEAVEPMVGPVALLELGLQEQAHDMEVLVEVGVELSPAGMLNMLVELAVLGMI